MFLFDAVQGPVAAAAAAVFALEKLTLIHILYSKLKGLLGL